jgi:hypothetical protein
VGDVRPRRGRPGLRQRAGRSASRSRSRRSVMITAVEPGTAPPGQRLRRCGHSWTRHRSSVGMPRHPGVGRPAKMADVVRAARDAVRLRSRTNVLYLRPGAARHFLDSLAGLARPVADVRRLYGRRAYVARDVLEPVRARVRSLAAQAGWPPARPAVASVAADVFVGNSRWRVCDACLDARGPRWEPGVRSRRLPPDTTCPLALLRALALSRWQSSPHAPWRRCRARSSRRRGHWCERSSGIRASTATYLSTAVKGATLVPGTRIDSFCDAVSHQLGATRWAAALRSLAAG